MHLSSELQLIPVFGMLVALVQGAGTDSVEPDFVEPTFNLTVPKGRDAELPCVVSNLGKYQVAWIKADTQTILTIHKSVVTRNYRITLKHHEHRNWFLHIRNVSEDDRGYYMCQINTEPMRSQLTYLDVSVSPNIIDDETSSDLVVNEGIDVTLTCRASGYPRPTVTWEREDNQEITLHSEKKVRVYKGEELTIPKVSRLHMGAYLCIASNHVPPAVSKRVLLRVHFSPMIWIPHQLVSGMQGSNVTIECLTEAYPKSINYWTNDRGDMITSGDKYMSISIDNNYKVRMRLTISFLEFEDFGTYKCYAKNSLGETDGVIRLYEIPTSTPQHLTTTDKLNFESKGHLGEHRVASGETLRSRPIDELDRINTIGSRFNTTNDPSNINEISSIHQKPQSENVSDTGSLLQWTMKTLLMTLLSLAVLT